MLDLWLSKVVCAIGELELKAASDLWVNKVVGNAFRKQYDSVPR